MGAEKKIMQVDVQLSESSIPRPGGGRKGEREKEKN
jgi:hypothetical protein